MPYYYALLQPFFLVEFPPCHGTSLARFWVKGDKCVCIVLHGFCTVPKRNSHQEGRSILHNLIGFSGFALLEHHHLWWREKNSECAAHVVQHELHETTGAKSGINQDSIPGFLEPLMVQKLVKNWGLTWYTCEATCLLTKSEASKRFGFIHL